MFTTKMTKMTKIVEAVVAACQFGWVEATHLLVAVVVVAAIPAGGDGTCTDVHGFV